MAAAPIPVSAARAEREAVLHAVNAEASRSRQGGIGDPVNLAVRIAAALNAEDRPDKFVYGFFWATAVSADGQILLANSYGLGYIPAGQNLPPQVRLVSLDDSVPLPDRVATATHPWLALQSWAQANDTTLRTIIGTGEHLKGIDLGTGRHILKADEIPSTSVMTGRDRLAVIAPEMAAPLAATADTALPDLLPPPIADAEDPEDRRTDLWFAVVGPMMSGATDRNIAHLKSFYDCRHRRRPLLASPGRTDRRSLGTVA